MTVSSDITRSALLSDCIALLQQRAKSDRRGVFWPLGANLRQPGGAQYENTIGFGTPGIVLFILKYYERTGDRSVVDLIERGTSWVNARLKNSAFQHGFYAGTAGVWMLFREVEKLFPGLVPQWRDQAFALLESRNDDNAVASLSSGIAGTILGIQTCLGLDLPTERRSVESLLKQLTATAFPSRAGVHWDFSRTSIKAPIGFLQGNAGIDYILAESSRRYALDYTPLLTASIAYEDSLFDKHSGNWLEQDNVKRLKSLKPEVIEKLFTKGKTETLVKDAEPEDSVSWGAGTLGIILSRRKLLRSYTDGPIARSAAFAIDRGVARLQRLTEQDWAEMDSSAITGLAGFAVRLEDENILANESFLRCVRDLRSQARSQICKRNVSVSDDDLSVLSGACGLAYAELLLTDDAANSNLFDPFAESKTAAAETGKERVTFTHLLQRRFPNASAVPEFVKSFEEGPLELTAIQQWSTRFQSESSDRLVVSAIKHEIGMYEKLSGIRFQDYFWSELVKQRQYAAKYNEGMDDNVLFDSFRIDESVTILVLDCDPYARPLQASSSPIYVLRQSTSTGVAEHKLSALEHALVNAFMHGCVALEAIRMTVKRVENPNVTQRQLAAFCLKLVRSYLATGRLVADPANPMQIWITRKRLKSVRHLLFPAGES